MEKFLRKYQKLHKEGKVSNGDLIAADAIATISSVKDALKMGNVNLAKNLITEHERNLSWLLERDQNE